MLWRVKPDLNLRLADLGSNEVNRGPSTGRRIPVILHYIPLLQKYIVHNSR